MKWRPTSCKMALNKPKVANDVVLANLHPDYLKLSLL